MLKDFGPWERQPVSCRWETEKQSHLSTSELFAVVGKRPKIRTYFFVMFNGLAFKGFLGKSSF